MIEVEYYGTKKVYIDHASGAVFNGRGSTVKFQDDIHARRLLQVKEIFRVAGSVEAEKEPEPEIVINRIEVEIPDDEDAQAEPVDIAPPVDSVETMEDKKVIELAIKHGLAKPQGRKNIDKLRDELKAFLAHG